MRNFTPWALSALLSLSLATPIEQRDVGDKTITVIDEVIVTVDVTKILYGKPPGPTPKQDKHVAYHAKAGGGHAHHAVHAAPKSSSPVPVVKPVEKVVVPATPPTSTTAPDQKTPDEIQAEINSKQIQINDEQKSKDIAHQNEMIALQNGGHQPTQQVAPPVQQPTPAAPVATPKKAVPAPENPTPATGGSSSSSSSGGGGSCGSIGGDCSGDVTIYNDQGAGACGWTNDTNSDDFFALAAPMFGTYSNDAPGPHKNAFCGREAEIVVDGKTFHGTLTDRCGGCVGQAIDLSQHLFSQIWPNEPPGNGRYHDIHWHFTSGEIYHGPAD